MVQFMAHDTSWSTVSGVQFLDTSRNMFRFRIHQGTRCRFRLQIQVQNTSQNTGQLQVQVQDTSGSSEQIQGQDISRNTEQGRFWFRKDSSGSGSRYIKEHSIVIKSIWSRYFTKTKIRFGFQFILKFGQYLFS